MTYPDYPDWVRIGQWVHDERFNHYAVIEQIPLDIIAHPYVRVRFCRIEDTLESRIDHFIARWKPCDVPTRLLTAWQRLHLDPDFPSMRNA